MYYEERIINGILHYRGNPFDKWTPKTLEQLTEALERLRSENGVLKMKVIKHETCMRAIEMLKEAFKEVE